MKCDVYFNLHKKLYSIRPCEGPQKGKVIAHCDSVILDSVVFRVSEASRQRVLKTKQKNVHATARGILRHALGKDFTFAIDASDSNHIKNNGKRLTYCPYRSGSFQTIDPSGYKDIQTARAVLLDTNGNKIAVE